jgi:hypothetical protein
LIPVSAALQPPNQPFSAMIRRYHIARARIERPIYDQQGAGMNARPIHFKTRIAPEICSRRVHDQVLMQV